MKTEQLKKIARGLRESVTVLRKNSAYTIPVMDGFMRRHIEELKTAADALEEVAELEMFDAE